MSQGANGVSRHEDTSSGRCGDHLPLGAFGWRRPDRGQRDNYCYRCRAAYKQEHYAANRQRYIDNAAARRRREVQERTLSILDYLRTHPSEDCGEADPVVLEFDHRNDKHFDISRGIRDRAWDTVVREIAKCDVVCANCHRRRTARRGRFIRAALSSEPAGAQRPHGASG